MMARGLVVILLTAACSKERGAVALGGPDESAELTSPQGQGGIGGARVNGQSPQAGTGAGASGGLESANATAGQGPGGAAAQGAGGSAGGQSASGQSAGGRAGASAGGQGSAGSGAAGAGGLSPASMLPSDAPSSLVFNDEFDATPTSSTYFFFPCWGDNNNPQEDPNFLQGETQTAGRSGLVQSANTVSAGKLLITGSKMDTRYGAQTFPYRSGRVRTKQTWLYGYFEARLKPAAGQGMWTTFWLMPPAYDDNNAWEIDIAEFPGTGSSRAYQNVHWGKFSDSLTDLSNVDADYSTAYHTFGVHWEASRIRYFIDGALVKTHSGPNVPNVPMQLIVSLDVGGPPGWVNDFDGTTPLPRNSEVDFLRIYQ